MPLVAALLETVPFPTYRRIALEAQRLRRLGLSFRAIAEGLGVSDKTVAKAVAAAPNTEAKPGPS